MFELYLV